MRKKVVWMLKMRWRQDLSLYVLALKVHWLMLLQIGGKLENGRIWSSRWKNFNILTGSHLQNQVKILKMTSLLSRSHLQSQVKVTLKKTTNCPSQNSFHLDDHIPWRYRKKTVQMFLKNACTFHSTDWKRVFRHSMS